MDSIKDGEKFASVVFSHKGIINIVDEMFDPGLDIFF